MEDAMKKFVEILRNNPDEAFDYIANNGYKFSSYELQSIIKELLYGIYYEAEYGLITKTDHDKILENTADQLEDFEL